MSMARHFLSVLLGACMIGISGQPAPGQEVDSLIREFLSSAPRQWIEYSRFLDRLQGTFELTLTEGSTVKVHHIDTIRQGEGCKLWLMQGDVWANRPKFATRGEVFAYNPRYAFALQRKTAQAPWVVVGVATRSDQQGYQSLVKQADDAAAVIHKPVRVVPQYALARLLEEKSFRVAHAFRDSQDSNRVTIEFDNAHPFKDVSGKATFPVHGGSLTFDAAHHWCVRSARIKDLFPDSDELIATDIEYRPSGSPGMLIPEHCVEQIESRLKGKKLPHTSKEWTYHLEEPSQPPAEHEFTLTAFGLAEPYGAPAVRSGLPWFAWVALAGLGCLVLGLGCHWLRRHIENSREGGPVS